MATQPIVGFEHAWRRLMHTMGAVHPNAVNRNRIVVRTVRDRLAAK